MIRQPAVAVLLSMLLAACASETPATQVINIPLIGPTVSITTPFADTGSPTAAVPDTVETKPAPITTETTEAAAPTTTATSTASQAASASPTSTEPTATPTNTTTPTETPIPFTPTPTVTPVSAGPGFGFETYASGFTHVVDFVFLPDGRMLATEKDGRLMLVENGQIDPIPVLTVMAETDNECGLLGIALDPNFASNKHVWIYYSTPFPNKGNQVVRFTLSGDRATDVQTAMFFPRLGGVCGHNAGIIHFGPDGMLYVSIGDNEEPANAQTLGDNHAGKIHRFVPTIPLGIPGDNPISGTSIYAYGLRNAFGFAWDPASGSIWATENGTYCDDEIDRIVPGGNYGWRPEANNACENTEVGDDYPYILPIINFDSSAAPTGIMFYTGDMFPQWRDRMFVCTSVNKWIWLIDLDPSRLGAIGMYRIPNDVDIFRCETTILAGPDGAIYFADRDVINRIIATGS